MKQTLKPEAATEMVRDGMTLLVGGFMGVASSHRLISAILARGTRDLTVIRNDLCTPEKGIGPLVASGQITRAIVSHIGLNPVAQARMIAGEMEIELVPQGTPVERIRAGGCGLGGVLTATGLGTTVAGCKQTVEVQGKTWLVETPLRGDVALLACHRADYSGNLASTLIAHNFNPITALAADTVIAEAEHIVPVAMIPPDAVKTTGVVVDYLLERAA